MTLESRLWQALVSTAVDGIIVIDASGHILSFNPAAEAIFGYAEGEMIGKNLRELMPEPDRTAHDGYIARYHQTRVPHIIGRRREVTGRRADGRKFPLELSVSEVLYEGRQYFMGTVTDISARKRAESDEAAARARLQQAERIAMLGHWEWNIVSNELHWSDEIYRIFALDPGGFKATYPAFLERVHPADRAKVEAAVGLAVRGEAPYDIDHRIVTPAGQVKHVHESGEVTFVNGRPVRMLGTVQDVTARKTAEEALQAALVEKETLIQEIHHRVKNNLQVTAGIITLQMDAEQRSVIDALRSAERRVHALALVHERLYRTSSVDDLDLGDYLSELHDRVVAAMLSDAGHVTLEKRFEPLVADLDTALPCGLILNELLMNALKYGVRPGGAVRAYLRRAGDAVELGVHDDGPGFAAPLDLDRLASLGLRLVAILARQLGGELEAAPGPGAHVRVRWTPKVRA